MKIKKALEKIFNISVLLKLVHGIFEIILGLALFVTSTESIVKIVEFIFSKELIEDQKDFLVNLLISFANHLSIEVKSFLGIYFVALGIINFWIAFILLTKRVNHYLYVEIVMVLLIVYQIYKFVHLHSWIILIFVLIDVFILGLIFKYHKPLLNK